MRADFPRRRVRAVENAYAGGMSGIVPNVQSGVVGCGGSGAAAIERAGWEQEISSNSACVRRKRTSGPRKIWEARR